MPDYGGITMGGFGGYGGRSYGGGFTPPRSRVPRLPSASMYGVSPATQFTPGMNGSYDQLINNYQNWGDSYNDSRSQNEQLFGQDLSERTMALQHKYAMEQQQAQLQAQMQMQMMMAGINLPTQGQVDTARGRFDAPMRNYQGMADNGMFSDDEENALMLDAYNQSGDVTRNMQRGYTDLAKSQGMGVNPNAIYYMGNAGQYQQAAARHSQKASLMQSEAGAKERAYGALTGIAGGLSDLDITPVRENVTFNMYGQQQGGVQPGQPIPYGNDTTRPKKGRYY